jgi:hypothetical protein
LVDATVSYRKNRHPAWPTIAAEVAFSEELGAMFLMGWRILRFQARQTARRQTVA